MKKTLLIMLFASLFVAGCSTVQTPIDYGNLPPQESELQAQEPTHYVVTAQFTSGFIEKYRYDENCNFKFALGVDEEGDGKRRYFNTYRDANGGVSNDAKHGLSGAIGGCFFTEPVTWIVPINEETKRAKKQGEYGYEVKTLKYITDLKLSGVKEGPSDRYTIDMKLE